MGISFLDDCFKKIKNLCGGDETCILLVLLVVGFLLCYLFQTEGFGTGYGYDGSCDANSNTECGAKPANVKSNAKNNSKNNAKNNAKNNSKNNAKNNSKNNAMVGLSPKPNRANAPSSMAVQMNSLGSVVQPDFGGNANGSINEVPVGIPARYLGAPIDMVFKNAKPLPNSQSGTLNANGKANGMANANGKANGMPKPNGKANRIANGNGTNSFGKQTGQNGESYNITFYYAPWCGHCKKMMPEFDKFDKEYGQGNAKINGKNVNVQKFNSDVDKEEIKKAGVRGFPDIRLNGNKLNVKTRTKDGIVEAIKNSNA